MNRLSDLFTRSTRVITVVLSVLLVVLLQIDSGAILRQITRSPELRAKLTAMSDSALSQADKIFDNSERAAAALADITRNLCLPKLHPEVDRRNIVTFRSAGLVRLGFILLNVADFKGIRPRTHFWRGTG